MTWVKICGITNLEDALTAVEAGADALGFVFSEKSPRRVEPEVARRIVNKLPRNVEKVGVVVNQLEDAICSLTDEVGLTAVQMHGDNEDPHVADLVAKKRPAIHVLAAIAMSQAKPEGRAMLWRPDLVYAFLADSGNAASPGGTGKLFDWSACKPSLEVISRLGRVVVAGGLTPANVGEAMRILKPWGVDVSSGVEARPGKKDPEKVKAFVRAVREADQISNDRSR